VGIGKKVTWFIGSDRKDRQVEWPKHLSNLFKYLAISSVARIEYFLALGSLYDKPSPQTGIFLENPSLRPMANRHKRDLKFMTIDENLFSLGPIELLDFAVLGKNIFGVKSCKEGGSEGVLKCI
jgi:hypothetical protein